MKIVIPGGSGQVGTILGRAFHEKGDEVVELSRKAGGLRPWRVVEWDGRTSGKWFEEIDGADVVINLAGRSVNCRYTAAHRAEIMQSRLDSTRIVGQAIRQAKHPPKVWLQAGTATIYAHRYDAANDERTGLLGGSEQDAPDTWRFSIDVATAWEQAAAEAQPPGATRLVLMRSALTLSPDPGGVFAVLLSLVRCGLGGQAGDGKQYVSWIHDADFIGAVQWIIDHDELEGAVNISAPEPVPNAEFMKKLRRAWGIRVGLPAAAWMLEIGAVAMRTETELILKSRRVVPARLLESGYVFTFPRWADAAQDLCERWRRGG